MDLVWIKVCLEIVISLLLYGDLSLASTLRNETALELKRNVDHYFRKICSLDEDPTVILHSILPENVPGEPISLFDAFKADCERSCNDKTWSSIHHCYALATVIGQDIESYFPNVEHYMKHIFQSTITPMAKDYNRMKDILKDKPPRNEAVRIFWTRDGTFDNSASYFEPNHVVPLLRFSEENENSSDTEVELLNVTKKPKISHSQKRIDSFFKNVLAGEQTPDKDVNQKSKNKVGERSIAKSKSFHSHQEEPINTPVCAKETQGDTSIDKETFTHGDASIKRDPKIKSPNIRVVKTSWFKEFKWLKFNADENKFYCTVCIDAQEKNIFVEGKIVLVPKKDDLIKHEQSKSHKMAITLNMSKKEMKIATVNSYDAAKDAIIAQMLTVYVQVKEAIPNCKNSSLLHMQALNGCSRVKSLIGEKKHYHEPREINEFIEIMASSLSEGKISPFPFYGIEVDEGTDSSNTSIVVVSLRYVDMSGKIATTFLGLAELSATTADDVFSGVINVLETTGLSVNNGEDVMVGIATDGASVMTGIHRGVAAKFKQINRVILSTHCMAHRLQLACEKAAQKVPYIVKYISILNQFAKSLKYSPKLKRALEKGKEITSEKGRKIHQVFFTRWLSFADSVEAMASCISAVISAIASVAIERGTEGRAMLHGVMDSICTVKFLLMTNFLADVIGVVKKLSLSMQKDVVHYSGLQVQIEAAILAIKAMQETPGVNLRKIMDVLPIEPDACERFGYKTHDYKDSNKQRMDFKRASECFSENLITYLESTFPDSKVMEAFKVFSPQHCRLMTNEQQDQHQHILYDKYKDLVDIEAAQQEWEILKYIVNNPKHAENDMEMFSQQFLCEARKTYPELSKLVSIGLCIPVTSVSCERSISAYNAIKTDHRSCLKVNHVNDMMKIYLHGPNVEDFDFEKCFNTWIEAKNRKIGALGSK